MGKSKYGKYITTELKRGIVMPGYKGPQQIGQVASLASGVVVQPVPLRLPQDVLQRVPQMPAGLDGFGRILNKAHRQVEPLPQAAANGLSQATRGLT